MSSINFSTVGSNISKDSEAFSKIQRVSKISSNNITRDSINNNLIFKKINNLYLNNLNIGTDSLSYGTNRQHLFSSLKTSLPSFTTLVDKKSFNKFFKYTLNVSNGSNKNIMSLAKSYNINYNIDTTDNSSTQNALNLTKLFFNHDTNITHWVNNSFYKNSINITSDGKNRTNPL